jgi:SPW repeat
MCFGSALDRIHGVTWTLPVFGIWLFASPWIFVASPTAGMIWSHVICGVLITLLGLNAVYFRNARPRFRALAKRRIGKFGKSVRTPGIVRWRALHRDCDEKRVPDQFDKLAGHGSAYFGRHLPLRRNH